MQAANNDGVWNTEGAAFAFTLRPHFYQTIWFYILLAALAAGIVLLLLRLRLLRAEREFRAVLAERNRIAREVHDTLAQGYVGVSVQLEVLSRIAARTTTLKAPSSISMDARQYVREGLAEARQSIWALRSQDSRRKYTPGEDAPRRPNWPTVTVWRRHSASTALTGPCRPERSGNSCAWRRKPSIM